jgi:hypothetical protein
MNEPPGVPGGDVTATIQTRLDEIMAPDYADPARRDLSGLDWLLFSIFVLTCAGGAALWGY